MSFGRLTPPKSPWEELQVTSFDRCLHTLMAIGKCTYVFRGIFLVWGEEIEGRGEFGGRGVTLEDLSMEEFVMGEDNFNEGGAGLSNIV